MKKCNKCVFPQVFLDRIKDSFMGFERDGGKIYRKNFHTYGGVRNLSMLGTYDYAFNYMYYTYGGYENLGAYFRDEYSYPWISTNNSYAYNLIINWHLFHYFKEKEECKFNLDMR